MTDFERELRQANFHRHTRRRGGDVSEKLAHYDVTALIAEAHAMPDVCRKAECVAPTVGLLADLLADATETANALRAALAATVNALALWERAAGEINRWPPQCRKAIALGRATLAATTPAAEEET